MEIKEHKIVITYKGESWENTFELFQGEELPEVTQELQEDWWEQIGSTMKNFDWEEYNVEFY
jgi:hypothetical protein